METAELRLAGVIRESIVDGPGWRFVVFTQGCPHHCEGCQNPQTHDFSGGYLSNTGNLLREIKKDSLLAGVTFSGGEPFCQAAPLALLARQVHELGLNVMTYSGWTFEELYQERNKREGWQELLEETDILVDGKFVLAEKSLALKFRGSRNQRIIDVKTSMREGQTIMLDL